MITKCFPYNNVNTLTLARTYRWIRSSSFEIGMQYHPPAYGRRVVLHPNFSGHRTVFTNTSSPESTYSLNVTLLLNYAQRSIAFFQCYSVAHLCSALSNALLSIALLNVTLLLSSAQVSALRCSALRYSMLLCCSPLLSIAQLCSGQHCLFQCYSVAQLCSAFSNALLCSALHYS